jgi:hypothetical protein
VGCPTSACAPRLAAVLLAVLGGALAAPGPAIAGTSYVENAAQFNAAVAADAGSGGRIILRAGSYENQLRVGARSRAPLKVVGERGAVVRELVLQGTRDVLVSKIAVRPVGGSGGVAVLGSSSVTLAHLSFSARHTRREVGLDLEHSSHLTITSSTFAHCGDAFPLPVFCLKLRADNTTTIVGSSFHDCVGCDFIHGRAGRYVVIQANRFDRAMSCPHATLKCQHDDLIELFAANGLSIAGNHFGISQHGGAQLYMSGAVDNVRIVNNLFLRTDPRVPGEVPVHGIVVGTLGGTRMPRRVVIVNNTILSGKRTLRHRATSIRLSPRYRLALGINRPVIANNVISRQDAAQFDCGLARVSTRNVITSGIACTTGDRVGPANLTANGRPTAASTLLINHAARQYAPRHDITHRQRDAQPDIGCYEYPVRLTGGP